MSRWVVALLVCVAVAAVMAHEPATRAERVRLLNAQPGMTWRAGINQRFAQQPIGAAKSLCGVHAHSRDELLMAVADGRIQMAPKVTPEQAAAIPTSFDSATNWPQCARVINDIRDQSNCGCCWAFGAAEAASDRLCINTNGAIMVPLSSQEMCFCASSDGCNGGTLTVPWMYIQYYGLSTGAGQGNGTFDNGGFCSNFKMPHCHHHGPQGDDPYPAEGTAGCPSQTSPACPTACDSTAVPPHNANDKYGFSGSVTTFPNDMATIQNAIMMTGPVEAAFDVYSDFEDYVSGVYKHTSGSYLGGHAIKIVGWGVDNGVAYWKVANSWNPYWGENGYFRIARGTNECNIESQVTASSLDSVWKHL